MLYFFKKTEAHPANKYTGPIVVKQKLRSGLYLCESEDGYLMRLSKDDIQVNHCGCDCHNEDGPKMEHFDSCCGLVNKTNHDKDVLLEQVLKSGT